MSTAFNCLSLINKSVDYIPTYMTDDSIETARVQITPDNGSYLRPDHWTLKVNETIRPAWFSSAHEETCFRAHKQWLRGLDKILVHKEIVHPFEVKPPAKISATHIARLKQWTYVWEDVWRSVRVAVDRLVWSDRLILTQKAAARMLAELRFASVWGSVAASVYASVGKGSVVASVLAEVTDSVWAHMPDGVMDIKQDNKILTVREALFDSVGAYAASFIKLPRGAWLNTAKIKTKGYPFQPCVDLWEMGLVPSFDGKTWRLRGGPKAAVLFEITAEKLWDGKP